VEASGLASTGNNGGAKAGNGGNGGTASDGGFVTTGDANADAGSLNSVNSNDTKVNIGHHADMNSSALAVAGSNSGAVVDVTAAAADTGTNNARGSRGGRGGSGGEVESNGFLSTGNNGGASAGQGGTGGNGGIGGTVGTGNSTSNSGSINVLNTNIVRVRI
jgi:hypothetical protein